MGYQFLQFTMISTLVVGNGAGNLFFIIAKKDLENFLNPLFYCGSGGRIRTTDLRVMSPTSYQTAPPRINLPVKAFFLTKLVELVKGFLLMSQIPRLLDETTDHVLSARGFNDGSIFRCCASGVAFLCQRRVLVLIVKEPAWYGCYARL